MSLKEDEFMRIFIAIRFTEDFKSALVEAQQELKNRGVTGNYCPYGNLHMTLAFIGETFDLPSIRKAVSEVSFSPFNITLGSLGTFQTKNGAVIWAGIQDCPAVFDLASQLRERLIANGVKFKSTEFYPHISLIRKPSAVLSDISLNTASMCVDRIFIMKSERIDGELIYSEIFF